MTNFKQLKNDHNKFNINDLNIDCHMLVLEKLDFIDMLAAAEASQVLSYAAAEIYRRTFSKKSIQIITPYAEAHDIRIFSDLARVRNNITAARIVKHFGFLISHLEIKQYSRNNRGGDKHIINDLINYYCCESLTQLSLDINEEDFFEPMRKPFINVKRLSIEGDFKTLNSKFLSFSELFPAINILNLKSPTLFDASCIDSKFNQLQTLAVNMLDYNYPNYILETDIKKLILKNPQIRDLTLMYDSRSFLRFISENLPNLEVLKLAFYDESNSNDEEEIRFENVKIFIMENCLDISAPKNIVFENLEEFETGYYSTAGHAWMELVANTNKLKKLRITGSALSRQELEIFVRIPTNITWLSARLAPGIPNECIINLVKNNQQLNHVHWEKTELGLRGYAMKQLHNELTDNWVINESNSHLELSRKK